MISFPFWGFGGYLQGLLVIGPVSWRGVEISPSYRLMAEILQQFIGSFTPLFIGFQHHPNGGWDWDFSHQRRIKDSPVI